MVHTIRCDKSGSKKEKCHCSCKGESHGNSAKKENKNVEVKS